MIIIILSAILLITGILLFKKEYILGFDTEFLGIIISAISGVVLLGLLTSLPLNHYQIKSEIQEYYAIKSSIDEARKSSISDIERAALTNKIIETNQWLASTQYWNNSILDIFIPDDIMKLEKLK